jgi:NTE family protein
LACAAFLLWLVLDSLGYAAAGAVMGLRQRSRATGLLALLAPLVVTRLCPHVFEWRFGAPLVELPVLAQVADWAGPDALSLLALCVNYALFRVWEWKSRGGVSPRAAVLSALLFLAGAAGYGALRLRSMPAPEAELDAVVLHLSVPLSERVSALDGGEGALRLRRLLKGLASRASAGGTPGLVVMPEALFCTALEGSGEGLSREIGAPVLYGARTEAADGSLRYNSAVLEDGDSAQMYHKHRLLFLGERIPKGVLADRLERITGRRPVDAGDGEALLALRGRPLGSLVCYETILADYVRRSVKAGAQLLVNMTEDGWYGGTGEPYQHLLITRLRAIETRRFLLRSVNNGVSAIVDPAGRVVASASGRDAGFLRGRVGFYSGLTPYVRWGNWLMRGLILALLGLGVSLLRARGAPLLLLLCAVPCRAGAPSASDAILREHLWEQILALPAEKRPKVGIALSGGAVRGMAHIGVLRVLDDARFPVDRVAGTSMGAIVGSLYASGMGQEELESMPGRLAEALRSDVTSVRLLRLFLTDKLLSTKKFEAFLRREIGDRDFGQLPKPFACVAMDLLTGEPIIFREGPVAPAVRASASLPGLFEPVLYRHRYLVDGGVVDFIPVDAARLLGSDWVLASVTEVDFSRTVPSNVLLTLSQIFDIRGAVLSKQQRQAADMVVDSKVENLGFHATDRAHEAVESGMRAAALQLNDAKEGYILFALPGLMREWRAP